MSFNDKVKAKIQITQLLSVCSGHVRVGDRSRPHLGRDGQDRIRSAVSLQRNGSLVRRKLNHSLKIRISKLKVIITTSIRESRPQKIE